MRRCRAGLLRDGIVEDIITALSRASGLFVIARNSCFAYRGKAVDVRQVGRELGVRYLLEGSVKQGRRPGPGDGPAGRRPHGGHVWAERYDRPLGDIFAVQDEVTAAIAARLGAAIERAETDLARRKAPADFGAYDLLPPRPREAARRRIRRSCWRRESCSGRLSRSTRASPRPTRSSPIATTRRWRSAGTRRTERRPWPRASSSPARLSNSTLPCRSPT